MLISILRRFIRSESASGLILCLTAVVAFVLANSNFSPQYQAFTKLSAHWVNDCLMTFFFLMVGLEIKREMKEGELNTIQKIILPAVAALGGMLFPALIYWVFNINNPNTISGFGIPIATDIAFSLGVLSLLGSRIPPSLKVFLMALAIFDDLGAIIVIALLYTSDLALTPIFFATGCIFMLVLLARIKVNSLIPYLILGCWLWFFIFKSGIHATLAGVILAFTIPTTILPGSPFSLLCRLESYLLNWVAFLILPIFAFMNAGVSLTRMGLEELINPIVLGVSLGLFLGKQVGVFFSTLLVVKLGLTPMPRGSNWIGIYGIALLCGIGFTMSFFVSALAFAELHSSNLAFAKTGVLVGSALSGIAGFLVLRFLPVRS
jgi:Na+:H+ antiporter, NhaA family